METPQSGLSGGEIGLFVSRLTVELEYLKDITAPCLKAPLYPVGLRRSEDSLNTQLLCLVPRVRVVKVCLTNAHHTCP